MINVLEISTVIIYLNSFTPETLENHYVCTTSDVINLNVLENRTLMYKLVQEKEIFPSIAKWGLLS